MLKPIQYRMTRQRQVILEELRHMNTHPGADEIHEVVRRRLPRISLGTVYRNLDILCELGEIQKLEFGGTLKRFDGDPGAHYHIRCVDSDAVVGVITQSDIFRAMIRLTGLKMRGIQFAFQIPEEPGWIQTLSEIIRRYGGRMVSLLSCSEGAPAGFRNVYIRVYHVDRSRFDQLREELKREAVLLYIVDHRENRREVY